MKKYLIGFIIAMISIIPISNVKALVLSNGTTFPDIPDGYDEYIIGTNSSGTVQLFTWNSSNTVYVYRTPVPSYSTTFSSTKYDSAHPDSSINIKHTYVKVYNLSNNTWSYSKTTNGYHWGIYDIYATSVDVYTRASYVSQYGSILYEAGYGLANKTPEISFQVNPLKNYCNGRDCTSITSIFSNVEDSSYTYQIKTDYTEWTNITLNTSYEHEYYLEYNSTFYARILDSSGNTLVENSINITGLYDRFLFKETISTNKYSSLEFDFEIPLSTSYTCSRVIEDDLIYGSSYIEYYDCISIDYEIFNSDVSGNINNMSVGIPYIEKTYLYDTGSSSITKVDTIPLNDIMSNSYNGVYELELDVTIIGLKLIIPFEYLNYSYVTVNLESNLNYEVSYIEREIEEVNYSSVDITGKAGVMFIPKQIDKDMLLGFNFDMSSTYSVQLRDTYKSDYNILSYYSIGYCTENELNDIPVICSSGSNGYQAYINFPKDNQEQSVFILNRSYPEHNKAIVYYDSRYFEYVIYDSISSTPTFTHPITGEEQTGTSLIDFNEKLYKEQNDGFFQEFHNAFDNFKDVILEIMENISYFFDNLNQDLKYFYMVIFGLVLFGFLIRFIL